MPLSFTEIQAWSTLHAKPLRPIEVELIKAVDSAYLKGIREVGEIAERERKAKN